MRITVDRLNIEFNEDIEGMKRQIEELKRLKFEILNSPHYKLLAGKTQMLGKGKGETKKERSRMLHTNSITNAVVVPAITQIYDRIAENEKALKSDEYREMFELNKKIAILRGEVMSLGHDIGHVADGHGGERAINDFFGTNGTPDEVKAVLDEHQKYFGTEYERKQGHIVDSGLNVFQMPVALPSKPNLSFEHNELGAILVNKIIERYGINLSSEEVRKITLGILGHSTSRTPIELLDGDLEAQIVRVADKVEYINLDYDEIASLIKIDQDIDPDLLTYMQGNASARIQKTVSELVNEAFAFGKINENHASMRKLSRFRKLYEDIIYLYDGYYPQKLLTALVGLSSDPNALREFYDKHKGVEAMYPPDVLEEVKKSIDTIQNSQSRDSFEVENAFETLLTEQVHFKSVMQGENSDRIHLIYSKILDYYYKHPKQIPGTVHGIVTPIDLAEKKKFDYTLDPNYTNLQRTLEYISLFDDEQMEMKYEELVRERIEKGKGYGVEPVTMMEVKAYLRQAFDGEIAKLPMKLTLGTRSYEESRNLYDNNSGEFFRTRLSRQGHDAMKKYYQMRFEEYHKDYELLQEMLRADQRREVIALSDSKVNETERSEVRPIETTYSQPGRDMTQLGTGLNTSARKSIKIVGKQGQGTIRPKKPIARFFKNILFGSSEDDVRTKCQQLGEKGGHGGYGER